MVICLALAGFLIIAVVTDAAGESPDEATIRKIIEEQTTASNRHDAQAWCKDLAEDAEFTNPFGMFFQGRRAIEKRHAEIFQGMFCQIRETVSVRRVRFLRPDVAIVSTDSEVTNYQSLPPAIASSITGGVFYSRATQTFVKDNRTWRIIARQDVWILKPPLARGT
jgi:uncharacterized protein (TIGR02246 family)